ncbi:MAG: peptidyl-prolyl cis-trans isomerase [Candidatus Omnitrophica bacterium]|nr:peptidyl-prolyl cis-trans isomerase [Candidatus Omnitrophota bacterium]
MLRMRLYNFLIIAAVIVLFSGCDNLPFFPKKKEIKQEESRAPAGDIVAKIGRFYITKDDLNKEIDAFNNMVTTQGMPQSKIDTREKKIDYLKNDAVRKYILYQEALDRGLDKRADIERKLENGKVTLLVSELLRSEIEKIDVTSKEIEDFYKENKDMLKEPEQRKISEILVPTEEDARQVNIELLKGGDFATLARQYSKSPTAAKGGSLGFISLEMDTTKRIRPDKFYEVAFSPTLDTGSISNIFKSKEGYYIIKLESVKKSEAKSLSELWDNIKSYLLFEKQQKAIESLANKLTGETKIEIYEGKVD